MALIFQMTDISINGIGINMASTDALYVDRDASVAANQAVLAAGAGTVNNFGILYGHTSAIDAGGTAAQIFNVYNDSLGRIAGNATAIVVRSSFNLVNNGDIFADNTAISSGRIDSAMVTNLSNFGTIRGISGAINFSSNTGTLTINNAGSIDGNISATSGATTFNSTLGAFNGSYLGGSGVDTVIGGYTSCSIFGGAGNDLLYANNTLKAAENHARTVLDGGSGFNALYGGGAYNQFNLGLEFGGTAGRDQIWGGLSQMNDVAGYLNNTVDFTLSFQGFFVDLLNGHYAFVNDTSGSWDGTGNFLAWIQNVPNVNGSEHGDVIQMAGNGGTVDANGGADSLFGAIGVDIYAYDVAGDSRLSSGYDTIVDFQRGTDKVDISDFMRLNGLTPDALKLTGSGNSTTVYVQLTNTLSSTTDLAFIVNSTGGTLTAADFIL